MAGTRTHQAARWVSEARSQTAALDKAISAAVDSTSTPTLDAFLVRLSEAANGSRIWFLTAAAVALIGGRLGRRAAVEAVASIGLASAATNLVLKSLTPRRRPAGADGNGAPSRRVRRPTTPSFPSGHTASAFAFASTMGEEVPVTWIPLHATAALVGYSRVHTGVHYPSDVAAGALLGALAGWTTRRLAARLAPWPRSGG